MVTFHKENGGAPAAFPATVRGAQIASGELSKPLTENEPAPGARTRLAWGAVVAGALCSLALLVLSNALAFACEIPAFRGGPYGIGSLIWSVMSAGVAFFAGGMVVEYLTRRGETHLGLLHGFLAWVLAVNLTALLSIPAFGVLRGVLPIEAPRVAGIGSEEWRAASINMAAWGVFLSLLVGMVSAAIGGMMGYLAFEKRSRAS